MSAEIAKILSRVKKLLTLAANDGATEGERDNAMRMAHATLAKHNLTMSQVDAIGNTMDNDPRVMHEFDCDAKVDWTRKAASGVGQLFFCYYYRGRHRTTGEKTHVFVGKSVNAMTAQMMTEYVIDSIKREAEKAVKLHYGDAKLNSLLDFDDGPKAPEASKEVWQLAFCAAAAEKVHERALKMRKEAEEAKPEDEWEGVSRDKAIVLASVYASELEKNKALIIASGINLNFNVPLNMGRNVGTARAAGTAYGGKLNLSRQLRNSAGNLKLGHNK